MTSPIIEDLKALMEDWSKSNNPLHGECFRYLAADLRAIIEKHEASAEGAKVDALPVYGSGFNSAIGGFSVLIIGDKKYDAQEVVAALRHQQAAQVAAVPVGYRLVPLSETAGIGEDLYLDAMMAFDKAVPLHQRGLMEWCARMDAAIEVLAASPEPPSP